MKSSCISHPANEKLVLIRKWQIEFCDGNHCAAALLAFAEYFHNWKVETDTYNVNANDVAEQHGETRHHSENVYQYHTLDGFKEALMGLYGRNLICEGLRVLSEKGAYTSHSNPNKKYKFDNKKYYQFHPDVCNAWIQENYIQPSDKNENITNKPTPSENKRRPSETKPTSFKNKRGAFKKGRTITEINNKELNQSINTPDNFFEDHYQTTEDEDAVIINTIIESLIEKGMPASRFYQDSIAAITQLRASGATVSQFIEGYDIATNATKGGGFGANYLIKVVGSLLLKTKQVASVTTSTHSTAHAKVVSDEDARTVFESNLVNGESWLSD